MDFSGFSALQRVPNCKFYFCFQFLVLVTKLFLFCMLFMMINKDYDLSLWKMAALFFLMPLSVFILLSFGLIELPYAFLLKLSSFLEFPALCMKRVLLALQTLVSERILNSFLLLDFMEFYICELVML